MDFPPRPNQLWEILVFLDFLDPRGHVPTGGGLNPNCFPIPHRQDVKTSKEVLPPVGKSVPMLHHPALIALVAEVLEASLGRGHSYILLYNHTLGLVLGIFLTQP